MRTVQAGLDTPGQRLQWAIDQQPAEGRKRGLRMFERAMRARAKGVHGGITGATLPSIKAYLNDTAWPSKTFWDEAGAALHVRPEWLAFGKGQPTGAHVQAAALSEAAQPAGSVGWQRERALRLKHAILKAIGAPKPARPPEHWLSRDEFDELTAAIKEAASQDTEPEPIPHWVAPLGEVWLRLYHRDTLLEDPVVVVASAHAGDDSAQRDAERRVSKALNGPLAALGIDAAKMREEALGDYLSAMVPALFALAAERARQRARRLAANKDEEEEELEAASAPRALRGPKGKNKPTKRRKRHAKA